MVAACRLDRQSGDHVLGDVPHAGTVHEPLRRDAPDHRHHHIVGNAMGRDDALRRPRLRHQGDAMGHGIGGAADRHFRALDADLARNGRFDTCNHARQGGPTGAEQSRKSQHLAPMQREADVFGFVRAGHLRKVQQNLAPRHVTPRHIGQPLGFLADDMFDHHVDGQIGQRRGDDMAAIPQDRGAVRDAGNLVHAVADIDDRHALGLQLPQKDEQPLHIRHRKSGRRFIQDQDARILADRLRNLG